MIRPYVVSVLREPLLHFIVLGAALFALDRVKHPRPARSQNSLQSAPCTELSEGFRRTEGRPPTAVELDALSARWRDDEVLYREGISRGLERGDPQVRQRVAARMAYVLQGQIVVHAPTEAEQRAYFVAHQERYAQAELTDFTQVFVAGDDASARSRADELSRLIRAGADPNGLGDRFSGGRRYRARRIEDLRESFGAPFVAGVRALPVGSWATLPSRFGLHLVRVDQRSAARAADFASARLDVLRDWTEDSRARALANSLAALRQRWHPGGSP